MIYEYYLSSRKNRLENDSKEDSLASVLEESVPTSTLLCEEMQKVLSDESVSPGYKLMIETSQLSVSSSDSLEDPGLDIPEISSSNEELDCVSQKSFKDPDPSTASRDREEHAVPETLKISSSKEIVCVSQKFVEDPPHSMASQDSTENPFPDPLEISSSKDFDSVPEIFVGDPPSSLDSLDRIKDPVPDKPETSASIELDCVSQEISEDRHHSVASRGRIEEDEQILVPDMLEPASAAAPQTVSDFSPFKSYST